MALKIILTDSALADFELLMKWSLKNYPNSSEAFGTALLNHVELLQNFPQVGAPVKGFRNIRRILHSPLYIYYRVDLKREKIEILRFRHAARRQPKF